MTQQYESLIGRRIVAIIVCMFSILFVDDIVTYIMSPDPHHPASQMLIVQWADALGLSTGWAVVLIIGGGLSLIGLFMGWVLSRAFPKQ